MSTALGIAGVTAVLESMLNSVYASANLGSVRVSALAPDLVQGSLDGGSAQNQVNLFLHQMTPNAAWRNSGLPSRSVDGSTNLTNQPLALDLHYLLTAYSTEDGFAEALLGYALLMLHQNPALTRNQINHYLGTLQGSDPLASALADAGLSNQVESLKISPDPLRREETAWIWTALKADYRPTYAFQVSVVLLEARLPVSSALPVAKRNISVHAGSPAILEQVKLPSNKAAATLGDTVTLAGQSLDRVNRIALTNQRFGFRYQPDLSPASVSATSITFSVPEDPGGLPAGIYTVTAVVADNTGAVQQSTNSLALSIAPTISPNPMASNSVAGTTVTLNCIPQVRKEQQVFLAVGGTAAPVQPFQSDVTSSSALTIVFSNPSLAPGSYPARLQIDGVESGIDWSTSPPNPVVVVPG